MKSDEGFQPTTAMRTPAQSSKPQIPRDLKQIFLDTHLYISIYQFTVPVPTAQPILAQRGGQRPPRWDNRNKGNHVLKAHPIVISIPPHPSHGLL